MYSPPNWIPYSVHNWTPYLVHNWTPYLVHNWLLYSDNESPFSSLSPPSQNVSYQKNIMFQPQGNACFLPTNQTVHSHSKNSWKPQDFQAFHSLPFTLVQRFPGRTSIDSLNVRPEELMSYVHGKPIKKAMFFWFHYTLFLFMTWNRRQLCKWHTESIDTCGKSILFLLTHRPCDVKITLNFYGIYTA